METSVTRVCTHVHRHTNKTSKTARNTVTVVQLSDSGPMWGSISLNPSLYGPKTI